MVSYCFDAQSSSEKKLPQTDPEKWDRKSQAETDFKIMTDVILAISIYSHQCIYSYLGNDCSDFRMYMHIKPLFSNILMLFFVSSVSNSYQNTIFNGAAPIFTFKTISYTFNYLASCTEWQNECMY